MSENFVAEFNAGHSSFLWLNSRKDIKVYSFDKGQHTYTKPMADFLKGMFLERFVVTFGDFRKTLPKFHEENPNIVCDLIFIDGGHVDNIPLKDIQNFHKMLDLDAPHLILIDDYPTNFYTADVVGAMWEVSIQRKMATTFRYCHTMFMFYHMNSTL